jgi:CheY-like chemotaxis protein
VELTFANSEIRVESASTGHEALRRLALVRPDLVLVDAVMPDPSGYEICQTIKHSEHAVPVVLLAGTFEPFDRELAAECGVDDHLVKPFESGTLRDKVEEWLNPRPSAVAAAETAEEEAASVEVTAPAESPSPDAEAVEPDPDPILAGAGEPVADELPAADTPSPALVEAVADAVVARLSTDVLREVAREVVPTLAERIIRERIRELESDD